MFSAWVSNSQWVLFDARMSTSKEPSPFVDTALPTMVPGYRSHISILMNLAREYRGTFQFPLITELSNDIT